MTMTTVSMYNKRNHCGGQNGLEWFNQPSTSVAGCAAALIQFKMFWPNGKRLGNFRRMIRDRIECLLLIYAFNGLGHSHSSASACPLQVGQWFFQYGISRETMVLKAAAWLQRMRGIGHPDTITVRPGSIIAKVEIVLNLVRCCHLREKKSWNFLNALKDIDMRLN